MNIKFLENTDIAFTSEKNLERKVSIIQVRDSGGMYSINEKCFFDWRSYF